MRITTNGIMKERHIEPVITASYPWDFGLLKFGITPSGGLAIGVAGFISIVGGRRYSPKSKDRVTTNEDLLG